MSLTSIFIPSSVTNIDEESVRHCPSLKKVYMSRNAYNEKSSFPTSVTFYDHGWYEVGPYNLFRDLIKKQRAYARPLNGDDDLNLRVIQKFLTNSNDDIFRNVLEYLIFSEKVNSSCLRRGRKRKI